MRGFVCTFTQAALTLIAFILIILQAWSQVKANIGAIIVTVVIWLVGLWLIERAFRDRRAPRHRIKM